MMDNRVEVKFDGQRKLYHVDLYINTVKSPVPRYYDDKIDALKDAIRIMVGLSYPSESLILFVR